MSDQPMTVAENFLSEPPPNFEARIAQHRDKRAEELRNQCATLLQRIQRAGDELRVQWPEAFPEHDISPYLDLLLETERDFLAAAALPEGWEQAGPTAIARAAELAREIQTKYHSYESRVVEPMVKHHCLLADPPIYAEAIEAFTAALQNTREQFNRSVLPTVRQNLQRLVGMSAARQTARLQELASDLANQARILKLAIDQVQSYHRELEKKYGVTLAPLAVTITPALPEIPESVTVTIGPGRPPAPALEGT